MQTQNYFELFGLPPRFAIDLHSLENSFLRLQRELHPDRHAAAGEAERRTALQLSTQVNDGYRALRYPATRAECLMILAGRAAQPGHVSPGFLMSQMEWREAIEEALASHDAIALEALAKRLRYKVSVHEKDLAQALDVQHDFDTAAQKVNELRFYEKLRQEIDGALEQLDS